MAKGSKIPDIKTFLAAGIDPKTRLPIRYDAGDSTNLDNDMRAMLRIIDEQDACNRYVWTGLPTNITGQELERMLYYKGQLVFFYFKELNQFYFMPYALDGTIDFYGRYNTVVPVPFSNGTDEEVKKRNTMQMQLLSTKRLDVKYGVVDQDSLKENDLYNSGVLLHDYTKQISQEIIPRQIINEPLLTVMAECVPFMRTSLIAGCGVRAMRVNDADQEDSVNAANKTIVSSAKKGKLYIPVTGSIDLQDLTNGQPIKSEEYFIAMQSLDNIRKSTHGIENGGLFEKKAHMLESENDVNQSSVMNQLQDGLAIRQNFCNIVNSIWGIGIWCEPSENVIQMDIDGDGVAYDRNADASKSSVENGDSNGEGEEE